MPKFAKKRLYTDLFDEALEFVADAHSNQLRRDGVPYISHLLAVAGLVMEMVPDDQSLAIAALLHDCVEDVGLTLPRLKHRGFQRYHSSPVTLDNELIKGWEVVNAAVSWQVDDLNVTICDIQENK